MSRKRKVATTGVVAAAIAALIYFFRFGSFGIGDGQGESDKSEEAQVIDAAQPNKATAETAPSDAAPPRPCRLLLRASGLSHEGQPHTLEQAIQLCKAAGAAELVIAGDALVGKAEETAAALRAAGIEVREIHKSE